MRILFAVHDWGLGHATRSLVLIQALLARGDEVNVLTAPGAGEQLLRNELDGRCPFHLYLDIPKPFSRYPALFYLRMSLAMPKVWLRYKLEHQVTERMVWEHDIDCVISDSRFGIWSRHVPSYCIFHSLRQIIPGRPRLLEMLVEWGQRRLLRHFARILIPDHSGDDGLTGDLGHHPALDWGRDRLTYIGPLSGICKLDVEEDIDYFFSISGIEPQRSLFEQQVLATLPQLTGRIVVTRGCPARAGEQQVFGNAMVYGHLNRAEQASMLNRARLVITRSGYTTLMELAELGKRALFIPTPGQSEQEYLAQLHDQRGHVYSVTQAALDLRRDLSMALARPGIPCSSNRDSVQRFLVLIR